MRQQYTLTPAQPVGSWTLDWQADGIAITNFTASPVYLKVGQTAIPSASSYDYIIPAGASLSMPCAYTYLFAARIATPLNTSVTAVNLTERVDITFVRNEVLPSLESGEVVKNILQSYDYSLSANGDIALLFDVRYTRSIQIACAPSTGAGRVGMDVEFGATETGPFAPYIAYRLPQSPETDRYLTRAIPVLGQFARLHLYELDAGLTNGTIYYTLSTDSIVELGCQVPVSLTSSASVPVGFQTSVTRTHDSGVLDSIHIRANGVHTTFYLNVAVYVDSSAGPGQEVAMNLNLRVPFDPALYFEQIEIAPYRIFHPNQDALEWFIPLNHPFNTRFSIQYAMIGDSNPPSLLVHTEQFRSNS